uniref:Uncharacterized protein n=1 Tax=Anopheles maculatus TaxID=74869 RepID=A0A182SJ76_9DIPT
MLGGSNRTKRLSDLRTHRSSSDDTVPGTIEMSFGAVILSVVLLPVVLLLLLPARDVAAHPSTALTRAHFNQPPTQPLRTLGTLGILFGAIEAEAAIERRLERLLHQLDVSTVEQQLGLERAVAGTLQRAQVAMEILGTGLELAASPLKPDASPGDFRRVLVARTQEMLSGHRSTPRIGMKVSNNTSSESSTATMKKQVNRQLADMRRQLATHLKRAVRNLGDANGLQLSNLATSLGSELIQRLLVQTALPKPVRFEELVEAGLKAHLEQIFRSRRQDEPEPETNEIAVSVDTSPAGSESKESESSEEEEGPGGLVGLIASLSGGDEGSDVGALIGSLSAVVTNLFGPGGLDVPGLLGTGTSLIAGLLGVSR